MAADRGLLQRGDGDLSRQQLTVVNVVCRQAVELVIVVLGVSANGIGVARWWSGHRRQRGGGERENQMGFGQ